MLAALLAGLLVAACSGSGDDGGSPTSAASGSTAASVVTTTVVTSSPTTSLVSNGQVPEGFGSVLIEVEGPDGERQTWCVLLARTAAERARGLMEVTSLDRFAGMLFDFEGPTTAQFYMLRTRIPLSVAFFAGDGRFVSSTDMEPCPEDDDDPPCPRYGADDVYQYALEVPAGGLEALGIGPGSTISPSTDPC